MEDINVKAKQSPSPFANSIGRKFLMGLTGLFLCTFLIAHLSGNFLLFVGKDAFDAYAHFMGTNPLIRILEIGLVVGFLGHIFMAINLTSRNNAARPVKYAYERANENSSVFSRNMGVSGSIVLIFLVLHLFNFFFKHRVMHDGGSMYETVQTTFANPFYSAFYTLCMVLLGFHLNHGFQSAFQTFGFKSTSRLKSLINQSGLIFSIVIPALYASMPLYFFIKSLM